MTETYNGWTNRETWAIQLHLSNNEGDYLEMKEHAEELVKEQTEDDDSGPSAVWRMAEYIEDWVREVYDSVLHQDECDDGVIWSRKEERMLISDVGSFWRADFQEIATHWIDEALESVEP